MEKSWSQSMLYLLVLMLLPWVSVVHAAEDKPLPKTALEACRQIEADWGTEPIKSQGPVPPFETVLGAAWMEEPVRDAEGESIDFYFSCYYYPRFDMPVVMHAVRELFEYLEPDKNLDSKGADMPIPWEEKDAQLSVRVKGEWIRCAPSAPSPGYLSVHCSCWYGGGNGSYTTVGMSFDTATQQYLRLQDIFADWGKAKPELERMVRDSWAEIVEDASDLEGMITTFEGGETFFFLTPEGLTLTFGYSARIFWQYNELLLTKEQLCPLVKANIWPDMGVGSPCP